MTTEELLNFIMATCVDAQDHIEQGCDEPAELVTSLAADIIEAIRRHDGDGPAIRSIDGQVVEHLILTNGVGDEWEVI